MRISDWSSDVCSSDLYRETEEHRIGAQRGGIDDAQNIAVRLFPHAQKLFAARQRRNAAHVDRAFVADAFFAEAHAASRGRTVRNSIFLRSEERRVGKEGVSPCLSRWSPVH